MASDDDLDLRNLLNWGKDRLKRAGIPDFDISAEILLRDLLSFTRSELILGSATKIDSEIAGRYKKLIEKRSKRYPLQYLTGFVEFYNVKLQCDPRALIPRPETEILVEAVIGRMKGWKQPAILDIGTGSGNIAIALAGNMPGSRITGIDISREALDLAAANVEMNGLREMIRLLAGDINNDEFVGSLGHFDCVVSNPPYVSEAEAGNLQPEIIEFEPHVALFSLGGPLEFTAAILRMVPLVLKPRGLLALEMAQSRAGAIRDMIVNDFSAIEIIKDLAGTDRILTATYSSPSEPSG